MEITKSQPTFESRGELLKPYVPRLLVEWVRDAPGTRHHALEGTLAFVDISGFTALTERLASRGKIGTELLRDTLDGVFTAILDQAYLWGAGLLKWGGDALLLLFDGDGHAERAARAAWEMQRTIERVGRIRVGGGVVTLRMSIGAATGKIQFFTAGGLHRELLVVGPVATEAVLMETAADAGEIALGPRLAEALRPWAGRVKKGAVLLAAPPSAVPWRAPDVGAVDAEAIAHCIPVAARAHVLLERSEPEHRIITAAFVDLMETDELLERIGPTAFGSALDDRISWIEEVAERYEVPFNVTDVSKGAIKVLLSAGAPSSTGHDEEQTLRMARELMDRPGVIPMRMGIATGRVFTGDFGPPYRRTYAVLGDAINTAARVMARAEAGQILATEEVLERSRTVFDSTPIEPFRAKGKAAPVRAALVGSVVGRRGERVAETPFVGRQRELSALHGVFEEVLAGHTWTVVVTGAPGIGKSRLLEEALAATHELRVLRSECEKYEASTPYFALREAVRSVLGLDRKAGNAETELRLRELVGSADPELVGWVPLLGILLGLDLPPTAQTAALDERFLREVLADVTSRFLRAILGATPVALVVEDAQFIDDASADLLRRLVSDPAATSMPCVLFLVETGTATTWTRADEEERRLEFALLPLSESEAARIVELVTDEEPLHPHEVEHLARRSGGSPVFLVELLNAARSIGSIDALPGSVEAVLTADIDRLSPSDRVVLRYASVLGVSFDEALLDATLQGDVALDEALWPRLRGLLDRDSTGVLRFRNTLVHDVAYEGLPFRRRRELHARVAEAIEVTSRHLDDDAATLALHFFAAARYEQAWRYARVGGDRARSVAANVEAGRLYELALRAGRFVRLATRRERADVLVALAAVHDAAGHFDLSYGALARATPLLADDPVEQARVHMRRARARARTAAYQKALRETTRGLRLLEGRDDQDAVGARAAVLGMRSEVRMYQGRARDAIRTALAAVEQARQAEELEALAHAYIALDGSYQMLGQPEKAVHERMALEIYRGLDNARLAGIFALNVGVQAAADGRWGEALELYAQAREDCLRAGDRANAAHADSSIAELLIARGRLDEAEGLLQRSRRVLRGSGYRPYALFAETQLARCLLEGGDPERAAEQLEPIVVEGGEVGYSGITLEAGLYRAHALARAGSGEEALAALGAVVAATGEEEAMYEAAIRRARAACLAALGHVPEACDELAHALVSATAQGLRYEQLLALRASAALPGASPSDEELRETERLAQLLDVPL